MRVLGQSERTAPLLATRLGPSPGDCSPPVDGSGIGPCSLDGTGRIPEAERDVIPGDCPGYRPRGREVRIRQRSGQAAAGLPEGHAVGKGATLVNGLDMVAAVQVPLLPCKPVAAWPGGAGGVCRGADGRCTRHPGPACHERSPDRETDGGP